MKVLTEDKCNDLYEDLLTVMEAHSAELETSDLIVLIVKFVALMAYEECGSVSQADIAIHVGLSEAKQLSQKINDDSGFCESSLNG